MNKNGSLLRAGDKSGWNQDLSMYLFILFYVLFYLKPDGLFKRKYK